MVRILFAHVVVPVVCTPDVPLHLTGAVCWLLCARARVRGIKQGVASRAGCRSARRHGVPSNFVSCKVRCMKGECADCVLPMVTHLFCVPPSCLQKHGMYCILVEQ